MTNFTVEINPSSACCHAKIYLDGILFCNTWKNPSNYPKYPNKFGINRDDLAFQMGFPAIENHYDTIQELVDYLEDWLRGGGRFSLETDSYRLS